MFLRNKLYNYTEHIILNLYLFAQFTIASFPISLLALLFGANYLKWTYTLILFKILFVAYALKRIFNLTWKKVFWKTILFLGLLFFLFIAIVIAGVIVKIISEGGIEGMKNAG